MARKVKHWKEKISFLLVVCLILSGLHTPLYVKATEPTDTNEILNFDFEGATVG